MTLTVGVPVEFTEDVLGNAHCVGLTSTQGIISWSDGSTIKASVVSYSGTVISAIGPESSAPLSPISGAGNHNLTALDGNRFVITYLNIFNSLSVIVGRFDVNTITWGVAYDVGANNVTANCLPHAQPMSTNDFIVFYGDALQLKTMAQIFDVTNVTITAHGVATQIAAFNPSHIFGADFGDTTFIVSFLDRSDDHSGWQVYVLVSGTTITAGPASQFEVDKVFATSSGGLYIYAINNALGFSGLALRSFSTAIAGLVDLVRVTGNIVVVDDQQSATNSGTPMAANTSAVSMMGRADRAREITVTPPTITLSPQQNLSGESTSWIDAIDATRSLCVNLNGNAYIMQTDIAPPPVTDWSLTKSAGGIPGRDVT